MRVAWKRRLGSILGCAVCALALSVWLTGKNAVGRTDTAIAGMALEPVEAKSHGEATIVAGQATPIPEDPRPLAGSATPAARSEDKETDATAPIAEPQKPSVSLPTPPDPSLATETSLRISQTPVALDLASTPNAIALSASAQVPMSSQPATIPAPAPPPLTATLPPLVQNPSTLVLPLGNRACQLAGVLPPLGQNPSTVVLPSAAQGSTNAAISSEAKNPPSPRFEPKPTVSTGGLDSPVPPAVEPRLPAPCAMDGGVSLARDQQPMVEQKQQATGAPVPPRFEAVPMVPSPTIALPPVMEPKPQTASIEEMVSKLKALDVEKSKHLAAVEELEKEKRTLAALIQTRIAEQKQQLDDIAAAKLSENKSSKTSGGNENMQLAPKLDTIIERLAKLEKRLQLIEMVPVPIPGLPAESMGLPKFKPASNH